MKKRIAAEHLFCSMGLIDSSLVAAAQEPRKVRKKTASKSWLIVLAAVISSLSLLFSVLMGGLIITNIQSSPPQKRPADALQGVLEEAETEVQRLSEDELPLFDGSLNLIWRAEGDEEFCVLDISSELDAKEVNLLISDHGEELSPSKAEEIKYDVWISFGDGTVISPYLKKSNGNIGYGELFTYTPEVSPASELTEIIDELINNKERTAF